MSNVVQAWRRRGQLLTRNAWQCPDCFALAQVRRRACLACGSAAPVRQAALPATGQVVALTLAGAAVEHLDQVTARKPAVWVRLGQAGPTMACLAAHADSFRLLGALRGRQVRLVVRRIPLGALPNDEPIPYGVKVALDLAQRTALKQEVQPEESQ